MGESQQRQMPLHRIRQGLMSPPPPIKFGTGGFKQLSRVIPSGKTHTARCQPTRRGVKEPPNRDSYTKLDDVGSPQWALEKCQLLTTLCVTLSRTLFALGGTDPTGGFYLKTLSFAGPSAIMGPVWDTIDVSCAVVAGTMCEE
jgi:hypothetical protein